jgi:broad specificity phosphatase PhoE
MSATTIDDLREVDFGDWTGHHWGAIEERFGMSAFTWLDQLEQNKVPNAESGDVLRARIIPCVHTILENHKEQSVAVVCHGGVIRVMLSHLLQIPLPLTVGFEVDYCSINVADCRDQRAVLQLLNHTPWRPVL